MFGWFNTAEPACFGRLHYRQQQVPGWPLFASLYANSHSWGPVTQIYSFPYGHKSNLLEGEALSWVALQWRSTQSARGTTGRGVETKKIQGEENSNALPGKEPATTSPHDISERKCDTPSADTNEPPPNFIQLALISPPSPVLMSKTHPSDALHFTPTDTLRGLFPYICKSVNGNRHTAIATSPTPDVPSCKLCLPYRRKHDITNFSLYMKLGLSFFFLTQLSAT